LRLLLVDKADRLRAAILEQMRAIFDKGDIGLEKRLARYPQLYSRVGFVQEFRALSPAEVRSLLLQPWTSLEARLPEHSLTDEEALAAIVRITGGNFRLLHRLLTQISRITTSERSPDRDALRCGGGLAKDLLLERTERIARTNIYQTRTRKYQLLTMRQRDSNRDDILRCQVLHQRLARFSETSANTLAKPYPCRWTTNPSGGMVSRYICFIFLLERETSPSPSKSAHGTGHRKHSTPAPTRRCSRRQSCCDLQRPRHCDALHSSPTPSG